jgi:hypothetical protein
MIEIPFVDALQERVKSMRVRLTVELRHDEYYLIMDGTETYPGNPEKWDMMWGGFILFATFHVRDHVHYQPKQLTTTRVEFKIGSVMDILKNT